MRIEQCLIRTYPDVQHRDDEENMDDYYRLYMNIVNIDRQSIDFYDPLEKIPY